MINIPKWVETASKDAVVAMAAKLADRLFDLRMEADEDRDCAKGGGCPACRPDPENCALRRASAALIEWDDGPAATTCLAQVAEGDHRVFLDAVSFLHEIAAHDGAEDAVEVPKEIAQMVKAIAAAGGKPVLFVEIN